jgi:hypothetical protein
MAAANTIGLTYTADIRDIEKKLAQLPEETAASAKRSVRELTKALKASAREQKKANKAAADTAKGLRDVGSAAGDSESSLRAIGGVLGMVSPEAEKALQSIAEFGGGLEGVTRGADLMGLGLKSTLALTGAVGVALAAAAVAYVQVTREMDRQAEEAKFLAEINRSLEPTIRRVEDAQLDLAVATGAVTEAEAEQTRTRQAAQRSVLDFAAAQAQQREELKATIEETQRYTEALDSFIGPVAWAMQAGADAVFGFSDTIADAQGKLQALDGAVQKEAASQKDLRDATLETTEKKRDQTGATTAQAAALRALTEAQAADRAGRSDLLTGLAAEREAREQLAGLQSDLGGGSGNDAIDQANALYERRVELLDQIAERLGYTAELDAAFTEAQAQRDTEVAEAEWARSEEMHDQRLAYIEERKAAEQAAAMQMASSYSTLAGGIAAAAGAASQLIADDNKKAAKALFAVEKAAGISQATINGAIAVTRALAMLGPIAGPIAAGGITATVGAQVALIAAQKPSFNDTPGVIQMPSGGPIGVAPGDMVVAGKDLDDMAAQVDRARGSDRRPVVEVVAIPSYQGRTYDRARRDAYRRPGPDRDAVNRDRANGPGGW